MLTRRQVARRLGKSVATVRRIEGILLEPIRDRRGIYRFDPNDVEELVEDVNSGAIRLLAEIRSAAQEDWPDPWCWSRTSGNGGRSEADESKRAADRDEVDALRLRCTNAESTLALLRSENDDLRTLARDACLLAMEIC